MSEATAPSPLRWLIAVPLIGLLGWLMVTMWHWGTADLKIRWARETMDGWAKAPEPEAWREVREILAEARDSRPTLPDAHEQLGRLYTIRAGDRDDPVARAMLRQARASYEQALRLRPASPYTWAGLARVTHRLGDETAFLHAIERADTLGPWELEVQLTVIDVGRARWDRASEAEMERTTLAARRALAQKPGQLLAYGREAEAMAWLCEVLERPAQFGRHCSSQASD
ncbi:MAG: hypothetical protein JRI55_31690 [Deltaproteobacteria bacterium]|nr:hypothetical protein [Deltaproteobacteria bacterium]